MSRGLGAEQMAFGANYTPRHGWFHSWLELDPSSVAADFAALKALGLDHVRIFPLWPLLQPNRTHLVARSLQDVRTVAQLAGDAGLDVHVDVLQGHLSSFDFLPSWVETWHRTNFFTDPKAIAAAAELISALTEVLADLPQVRGLSLGNEIGQFAAARHPEQRAITPAQARAWTSGLLEHAARVWPDGRHTHSYDDELWFVDEHPFTPDLATQLSPTTTVHSWVFTGATTRLGNDHPDLARFGRYLVELAQAWSPDPTRPVWVQEIGAPTPSVSADQAPDYARRTLVELVGSPAVEAVTWWCSHDVSRSLADFPELEYSLGLIDEHSRVKPIGRAMAELIDDVRSGVVGRESATGRRALVIPPLEHELRSLTAPHGPVFLEWLALGGDPAPALLPVTQATGPDLLEARGITTLIDPLNLQTSESNPLLLKR